MTEPRLTWCATCGEVMPEPEGAHPMDFILCERCIEAALAERELMEQPL